jgi:hypothetical protein
MAWNPQLCRQSAKKSMKNRDLPINQQFALEIADLVIDNLAILEMMIFDGDIKYPEGSGSENLYQFWISLLSFGAVPTPTPSIDSTSRLARYADLPNTASKSTRLHAPIMLSRSKWMSTPTGNSPFLSRFH